MRRFELATYAGLVTPMIFFGACAAPSSIVISTSQPSHGNGWTKGELSTEFSNTEKRKAIVVVDFRGKQFGQLASYEIRTDQWKTDLRQYVASLSVPYPSRTVIVVNNWDASGSIDTLIVQLPYLAGDNPNLGDQRSMCRARELVVRRGAVIESRDFDISRDQCWV